MQENPNPNNDEIIEPWNLIVSDHAIERYRMRTGGSTITKHHAANKIRGMVENGTEMVLKDKTYELQHMLKHDLEKARFFKSKAFMVVVYERIIKTVHLAEANRWVEKKKPNSSKA